MIPHPPGPEHQGRRWVIIFSSIVMGVRAPWGKAPSRGGLHLIKALCVRIVHGRCCGSKDAGGDDVNIMIIIIFREVIVVSMALREESWASYLGGGALPNCGACRSPFLIAEGAVATSVGTDISCPNSRCSSKWQFACFAPGRWFGKCRTSRRSHCHVGREGAVANGRLSLFHDWLRGRSGRPRLAAILRPCCRSWV